MSRAADCVSLEVQDDGKGMSVEKLSQIRAQGSGVGIAGMRERIRQFGGQFEIESTGAGTTMSFSLPLVKGPEPMRQGITHKVQAAG
jgi:signal transduction histidine kinase